MSFPPITSGMDRRAFVARLTVALERPGVAAPREPAPVPADAVARITSHADDLPLVFAQRAAVVGMVVHPADSAGADGVVVELLLRLGARSVAIADSPLLRGVGQGAASAGLDTVRWQDGNGFEPLYAVDVGVTDVQAGIAETGSLVCCSGPGRGRGLSLVPPVHIAVVRRTDLCADLLDYWARCASQNPGDLPSSITLISGPSKTADIEGVLITGVHGPREVHIVLIEDR